MYNNYRNWYLYNQQLVNRGRVVTFFLKNGHVDFKEELRKMNENKKGKPYEYPSTIMSVGFAIKCIFHMGYRQLQGYMEDVCKFLDYSIPNFRTFWWRVDKLEKQGIKFNVPKENKINVAIDSTGLKLVNDGEYRTMKYRKLSHGQNSMLQ